MLNDVNTQHFVDLGTAVQYDILDVNVRHWKGIVMLAEIIKIKRIERGLTQEELARIVGISRSYYSDIENNRTIPSGRFY